MASKFTANISQTLSRWVRMMGIGQSYPGYRASLQDQDAMVPEKKFHLAIQRECARADRNGHGFSLVIFDIGDSGMQGELAQQLVTVLQQRLRMTDEAGWFSSRYVGVILYGTPLKEGAWRFANDIWELMSKHTEEPPQCTVYSYPADWRHIEVGLPAAQPRQRQADQTTVATK